MFRDDRNTEHNTGQFDSIEAPVKPTVDRIRGMGDNQGDCWDCGAENVTLYMKGLCAHCYVLDNY